MNAEKHVPSIDELISLPVPDDPQLSPDGSLVAYTVTNPDWDLDEFVSQIWLAHVDGSKPRQLTYAASSSMLPRWSPDGHWLAFLSKRDQDNCRQIYRISPFGGEAVRLTESTKDISAFAWSPNGQYIAYVSAAPETEEDRARVARYGVFRVEDQDYEYAQLWLLSLKDRKCHQLTRGEGFHAKAFVSPLSHGLESLDIAWSPDSTQIAFEAWPTPDYKNIGRGSLYKIHVETGKVTQLTEMGYCSPRWSPDGTQITCSWYDMPCWHTNTKVCILPAAGGEIRVISDEFDESAFVQDWGPDGIFFFSVQRTASHLFCIDPEDGRVHQLTPTQPEGWLCNGCSFDKRFKSAAMIASDVSHYADVVLLNLENEKPHYLTNFNSNIETWQLGKRELIQWNSTDGTLIEGVLIKPPQFNPNQKYPLLVVIHGGPGAVTFQALLSGYELRYYPIQQWVAEGALILQPNYRGSAGYGESFRGLNVGNLGLGDYADVISGVDALIERGWVDIERVGSMGWSQGGYISAFITTYSDRFQAVSVGAGVSNWVTYYANTDVHSLAYQYLDSTPWENPEVYRNTSPMTYIQNAKTPTLILHGDKDQRVPIPNAYELYQGLLDKGVEVRYLVYPGMGHPVTGPRTSRHVMEETFNWFDRWLWPDHPNPLL